MFENHTYVTKGLKPEKVFKYFEEISQIPRGSHNEKAISDYLVAFGKSLGLETIQDEVMNVIIKKPGSAGYENSETVMLQGHMDMVCEKNADTDHDFLKDPLKLYIEGDLLKAKGTTLGADNGIAVAYAMAVLDSDLPHPPLEVIITVEEETGMGGVIGFNKDNVSGKMLLNMDSEEEGIFCASCAGGVRANIRLPIEKEMTAYDCYKVKIRDLKGGHSGINIKDGRGNAIKILGRLLNAIDGDLVYVFGGSKPNAIPREAEAIVAVNDYAAFKETVKAIEKQIDNELFVDHVSIQIEKVDNQEEAYSDTLKDKIIKTLLLIPCGVQTMSFAIENLVESSLNIGVLSEIDGEIVFESAIRSSVKSLKYEILERLIILSELVEGRIETVSDYPEWAYNPNSKLQDLFKETYLELTGQEAKIEAIHAGLECGFFAEKLTDVGDGSDLDMISFGPNMANVHTPDEELSIASVERTYKFFLKVLEKLK